MALDNDYIFAALPTPTDTPYRTPSRGISRRSSRRDISLSKLSSSSPPQDSYFPPNAQEKNSSNDEETSPLDPRRFTPTLHASLVSEILSLRREVDNKNKLMEKLEENMHTVEAKNEGLNQAAAVQSREISSLNKQLHSLENETLSAVDELSKERDVALDTLSDTRRRLETSLNQQKSHEEDAERIQGLWDQDRQKWDIEKSGLDRKLHLADSRLKTVVAELAEAQAQNQEQYRIMNEIDSPRVDSWFQGSEIPSTRSNSVKGHVRHSSTSDSTYNSSGVASTRFSAISGLSYFAGHKPTGLSLAEELDLEEGDDEHHRPDSRHASSEILPRDIHFMPKRFLAQAQTRRMLGFEIENNKLSGNQDAMDKDLDKSLTGFCLLQTESVVSSNYFVESATQYSLPLSPRTEAHNNALPSNADPQSRGDIRSQTEGRDYVAMPSNPAEQTFQPPIATSKIAAMISAGCQTVSEPLSPLSPKTSTSASQTMAPNLSDLISASTQTDTNEMPTSSAVAIREDTSTTMVIPAIAIYPPVSTPPTPRASVTLPPRTKSIGCQTIAIPIAMISSSMQTESRIQRGLPSRLPLSASSTKPMSPSKTKTFPSKVSKPRIDLRRTRTPPRNASRKGLRKAPSQMPTNLKPKLSNSELNKACVGFDQDRLLDVDQLSDLRRPAKPNNHFPQADGTSDQLIPGLDNLDLSDDDFGLASPVRKTLTKVKNSWKLVSQPGDSVLDRLVSILDTVEIGESDGISEKTANETENRKDTPFSPAVVLAETSVKPTMHSQKPDFRRAAFISSGVTDHAQRSASSIAPGIIGAAAKAAVPPFPVPTRSSSRRIPISASDGASTPTPQITSFFTGARGRDQAKVRARTAQAVVLRKVQSATTVPKLDPNDRQRDRSCSPPPIMPSTDVAELPQLPPLPQNTAISQYPDGPQSLLRNQSPAVSHTPNDSIASTVQPARVVDAIAQTMVGEWMWKYVRRRKSFGITDSPQVEFEAGRSNTGEGSTGIRHKRWVWLAPYERAVIWSAKQPMSGSALLGKSGRKLAIQSVLDVKDDTPMPKNTNPQSIFGRSILILTPQRALKFTATTMERHQLWLTALSFLSHSTPGVDDLAIIPKLPCRDLRQPLASDIRCGHNSAQIATPKERPPLPTQHAYSSPIVGLQRLATHPKHPDYTDDGLSDAAEPPNIPRMTARTHNRKRSNTGSRPVAANSHRGLGTCKQYPSTHSLSTATSMDTRNLSSTAKLGQKLRSGSVGTHRRPADAFQMPSLAKAVSEHSLLNAMGTMRMEAFVEGRGGVRRSAVEAGDVAEIGMGDGERGGGLGGEGGEDGVWSLTEEGKGKKPVRKSYRIRQGRKKDMSWWGAEGRVDDPFGEL